MRALVILTPAGFEEAFRSRVELLKRAKPGTQEFLEGMRARVGKFDVEQLGDTPIPGAVIRPR
jgi:hypothetical protein